MQRSPPQKQQQPQQPPQPAIVPVFAVLPPGWKKFNENGEIVYYNESTGVKSHLFALHF